MSPHCWSQPLREPCSGTPESLEQGGAQWTFANEQTQIGGQWTLWVRGQQGHSDSGSSVMSQTPYWDLEVMMENGKMMWAGRQRTVTSRLLP